MRNSGRRARTCGIGSQKDEGLRRIIFKATAIGREQTWQKVYQACREACDRAGLVDFAELLLRAHEAVAEQTAYPAALRERFTMSRR
ncbi:hypothetical protein [Klebsiella pneumoniae]|uniref:hypothetical protein n=1 Tax=Klebsiella pneumoniae TaxID=573 RepID=UPI00388DA9C2